MSRRKGARASAGQFANAALTARILELRQEKAKLLGFANFADLVLVERMAKTGAAARAFVDDLYEKTKPFFAVENEQLATFAGQPLEAWDIPYWAEKQRAALEAAFTNLLYQTLAAGVLLSAGILMLNSQDDDDSDPDADRS